MFYIIMAKIEQEVKGENWGKNLTLPSRVSATRMLLAKFGSP